MIFYIMLANLILFTALFNAVCIMLIFLPLTFVFMRSLRLLTVCLRQILFCVMHSAFNLLDLLISCLHIFMKELSLLEKYQLKITIIMLIVFLLLFIYLGFLDGVFYEMSMHSPRIKKYVISKCCPSEKH